MYPQILATISYKTTFNNFVDIPIGNMYGLKREDGDIVLARNVASDCPLKVAIQIKSDGTLIWWYSEWENVRRGNPYWHFSNGCDNTRHTSAAQIETLRKMQNGEIELPGGLTGSLGSPVIAWAFGEREAWDALVYHA